MKNILFCFLTLLSSQAIGQDYVVTLKHDTIRGDIKILTYGNIDRVDAGTLDGKKHFTAIQVASVMLGSEVYKPVGTTQGFRMMKLVTPGFLSLYHGRQPSGYLYDTEYLVKRDGSAIEVPNLSFKRVMTNFLSECRGISERIKKDEFSKKDINKIIREYNDCLDLQTKSGNVDSSVALENPIIIEINSLKTKIENSSMASKSDALDVLKDIAVKVASEKPVPNYLSESFKGFFKDAPEMQPQVDKILGMLKK